MNPEWVKEFIKLVKTGAPIKAYQKKLGLNRAGLQYHLGRLAEYEASLEVPADKQRLTEVKKKIEKVHSVIETIVKKTEDVEPEEEMPEIDYPEEVFDILISENDVEDIEDEDDETL